MSSLKSSGTSNVVMYSSDPSASIESHFGIMERHLLDGTGNATTDCDALCRSRAVILEGIFVVSSYLVAFVVYGILSVLFHSYIFTMPVSNLYLISCSI